MASNVCWGVEVGAWAVKAVKLERTSDGVNVLDYALIPHKRVLSTPEIDEKEAKRVALGTLISQHDLKGASLAVSVPGHSTFARFAKLPPVEPKKIPDIVKFEAVQQIPFPIDDVEWDYQTFASPDMPDVEVGIFAMTRERVMEKLAKWQDVGQTPDVLTLSPLAAYNAMSYDLNFSAQTPGTVLLDVGTTSTDLIVAEGGRLWIRTFPIGGHQFTEALVTAFNLSYTKAEKLKKEAESTQHTRHVLQAMRPVFGDLAQDVQRSIGYYQSTHKNAKLTRLIGLGSTFNLPGLRKFLSQQLQIEVVRLEGWNRIKMEGERDAVFQQNAMLFSTAVGCALQGLGLETISANLMPVPVVREALWAKKTPWFVAAACVGLAAGGASFLGPVLDSTGMASKPKPTEIDIAKREAKAKTDAWKTAEAEYKPDPRAESSLQLLRNRDMYAYLLGDLSTMMALAHDKDKSPDDKTPPGSRVGFRQWDTQFLAAPYVPDDFGAPTPGARGSEMPGVDPDATKPRVHCKLEIAIARPEAEADKLVNEAFVQWLNSNRIRADVPYTISIDMKKALKPRREKIADLPASRQPAAEQPRPDPSEETTPAPVPGRGRQPVDPRGVGPGGRGRPSEWPQQPEGGFQRPQNRPSQPTQAPGADDVNKLAPLPPPEPLGPPGSSVSYFTIEWDAVIKPAEENKEAGK